MTRIFLSHSGKDKLKAKAFKKWLASEGWNDVFLDIDPDTGLIPGDNWSRQLNAEADRCKAVIFLMSRNWLAGEWCDKEYDAAKGLDRKLFVAIVDPNLTSSDIPPKYTVEQAVEVASGRDCKYFSTGDRTEENVLFSKTELFRLRRGLLKAGLSDNYFQWPPQDDQNRYPYRGFEPIYAIDAGIYFGREARIADALKQLRDLAASGWPKRLFVIQGASGAGKSSFMRAGLLPRLERDDLTFRVLPPIRPGLAPLGREAAETGEDGGFIDALAEFLRRNQGEIKRSEVESVVRAAEIGAAVGGERRLLGQSLETATAVPGEDHEQHPTFVIAIDQAEELFDGQDPEESNRLLALLAALCKGSEPSIVVIFAIRTDKYDKLQNADALAGLDQATFPLPPMLPGDFASVIEGPARRATEAGRMLTVEPELREQLLSDISKGAGDPFSKRAADPLPLLAVRRPRHSSLTDRNCEGFCRPGNRGGLPGLHGGGRSPVKLVSEANSLLTGKITGNFSIFGGLGENRLRNRPHFQFVMSKFPKILNREINCQIRE